MGTTAPPAPKTPPDTSRAILELKTLAPDRPYAEIDDVRHDFRLMQEFGAVEHQQFTRGIRRYDELWNQPKLTPAEQKLMTRLLERLFRQTLVNADALTEQLGDRLTGNVQREVLLAFTNAPLLMAMAQEQTATETDLEADLEAEDSSTTES